MLKIFCRPVSYKDKGYYDDMPEGMEYYENDYLDLNPTLHEEDVEAKFEALQWALVGPLQGVPVHRVLDVGCGSCRLLIRAISHLEHFTGKAVAGIGVDVSGRILQSGVNDSRIIKLRADCRDIPLKDGSINLALCFDIVEHVEDEHRATREIARLANYAVFKVPLELSAYTSLRGGERRLRELQRKYGHVNHYNRQSLLSMLNRDWKILAERYIKIPRRGFLMDGLQRSLLAVGASHAFAALVGGFMIVAAESKRSVATTDYACIRRFQE